MVEHHFKTEIANLKMTISDEPGPDFLTTSQIQKGLIANYNQKVLTQEGLGFGVPIVRTSTETIFSRHAQIEMEDGCLIKIYDMDCVSRITFGGKDVHNKAFRWGLESLVKGYMRSESLQPSLLKIQQKLAKYMDALCTFMDIPSVGKVKVKYLKNNNSIDIESEFEISIPGAKFIMANEQGADFFDYAVVDNRHLSEQQLKGWIKAQDAMLKSRKLGLWFSVRSPPDVKMFLGRERNDYLCWSGINLERNLPSFNYIIKVGGCGHD
jgi:hypothetical protein